MLVFFALAEIVADLVGPFDVRASRWVWPYLLVFYLAQWAVIGAATVLASHFVCLAATVYSYRRVGHGPV